MYQVLLKDEKKEVRNKYRASKRGASMMPRLNRLIIEGIFLFLFPIVLILVGIFTKEMYWWMWTLSIVCLIASIVFILGQYIIRMNEYNNFIRFQNELKKKLTKRK